MSRLVAIEPQPELLQSVLRRYFLATRPAFLSVTVVAVLLGWATAWRTQRFIEPLSAALTLLFALAAHAGANVLNDYYDHVNGTDAANSERLFPFTGGSRIIQNGVLSPSAMARFGAALMIIVVPPGLWLAAHSGTGLIWIGASGLLIGWAYSAPPLKLASRGFGEFAIAAGWWLIVVGSDFVQSREWDISAVTAGLGYGLMVANLLYINQFPDANADSRAGKMTIVARLGRRRSRAIYVALACSAFVVLPVATHAGILPPSTLLVAAAMLPAGSAAYQLWEFGERPQHLLPAIKQTILAVHLYGLLLVFGLLFWR